MDIHTELPETSSEQALAIGTFDGLHPGHCSIIQSAVDSARESSLPSAVLTFEPDPVTVLTQKTPQERRLLTREDKISILSGLGVDRLYEVEFTREFASIPARQFVEDILISRLNVSEVFVGYDFRFGNERQGDTDLLRNILNDRGIEVRVHQPVTIQDEPISSTKIREFIRSGNVERARQFLKRPYTVRETVEEGEGRGKSIGFPTINFPLKHTIHPREGVYLVWLGLRNRLPAIANFGERPTVDTSGQRVLEVHTLPDPPDIGPGDTSHVYFEKFIRDEQKFDSVYDLKDQIAEDVREAEDYFESADPPPVLHDNVNSSLETV